MAKNELLKSKNKAGAPPVEDKKKQVQVGILTSHIIALGGYNATQNFIKQAVAATQVEKTKKTNASKKS